MKIDVKKIAQLANLPIADIEEKKLEAQLKQTLEYIESLNEVDTNNTSPTNQVTNLHNVLREDITKPSLPQEDALKNAKSTEKGMFKIAAILQE